MTNSSYYDFTPFHRVPNPAWRFSKRLALYVALLTSCLTTFFAVTALASDGVLEINQTCVVRTGCIQGDFPGFPMRIDTTYEGGRSFRLTSDLIVPDGENGIVVFKDSVSLDLNGFRIVQAGCETGSSTCNTTVGTTYGIYFFNPNSARVRGGSIIGMGFAGIAFIAPGSNPPVSCHISDVTIKWTGGPAIYANGGCTIVNNRLAENGTTSQWPGIWSGAGSVIIGNSIEDSAGHGIQATDGNSLIKENRVIGSGIDGIYADGGNSVISGNVSAQNVDTGIRSFGSGSIISRNSVSENDVYGISVSDGTSVLDNVANENGSHGIRAFSGSSVNRNVARSNTGFGFSLTSAVTYRANTVTNNTAGTVNSGIDMGGNSCDATTSCP